MGEGSGGEGECGGYVGDVQELYVGGVYKMAQAGDKWGEGRGHVGKDLLVSCISGAMR